MDLANGEPSPHWQNSPEADPANFADSSHMDMPYAWLHDVAGPRKAG
jgi:hypothetical protein